MGEALIDLAGLAESVAMSVENQGGTDSARISLAALKFTSETIDTAKEITTEGISEKERASYIRRLSEFCGAEIFEFSTTAPRSPVLSRGAIHRPYYRKPYMSHI